ncbi:macrophage mannose receptor 1-like isoform X2 [Acipenser ruthenus]|uniref:macrophage mannose receptor 1-like isoform X2 n=1 Tax=Acipenser ruthenus TaxID=7906 RepID=UPI002740A19A|nr:macrophage mannose receptor 1-like isoform X2 [Acipenser ruthenus]
MEKTALVLLCLAGFCVPASNQIRKFLFVKTEMSWSEAQGYCREKHTDLATVRSQEEAEQLLNITGDSLNDTAWFGLYRDDTQNWQWSNSDDVIYSNWRADLFCASVNSQGEWEDRVCNEKEAFMCYTETSNITERYTLIEGPKTWTEAQQYCREHHTDLVSIKNASENADLVKKAQGKPFWIGLFNNPWKWSRQGDNYTFHSWYRGKSSYEPNNEKGNEKCVVMNEKAEWYDTSCSEKFLFVCCSGGSSGNCSFEGPKKTWHEAQSYCRNHNKDLVTIQDKDRMKNILDIILGNSTWIGLHRDKENWQWSNGGDVIYSNWTSQLFCASVNSNVDVWDESLCKETKLFMCYNETSNITERYTLIEEMKTWTEAQQYCREHHTDLVSIKSASENEDLVKKAQGKPFWIGLFNNLWKWSHQGDNYTFQNWNTVEPNNMGGNENCVVLALRDSQYLARGKWNDQNCKLKRPFFCFDDHMAIGRVKFTAPRGMNLEDPKVSEAILEQIREHLSKSSPMDGVKLRWRKQDGEIFHKAEEEEEEEEEGCPKP